MFEVHQVSNNIPVLLRTKGFVTRQGALNFCQHMARKDMRGDTIERVYKNEEHVGYSVANEQGIQSRYTVEEVE